MLLIPLHSAISLITNSSSEVFISSDSRTVKSIHELVDNLFSIAGSTLKSKDIFQIDITKRVEYLDTVKDKYVEEYYTDEEIDLHIKNGKLEEYNVCGESEYGLIKNYLRLTPLVPAPVSPEIEKVCKRLADLTGMFEIEST